MSHQQNAERGDNIKIANKPIKNVAMFTYLETKLTNRNYILEEIKSKLSAGNFCYDYSQTLSSFLLSKK